MNKEQIREKTKKSYLSAQEYNSMSDEEKGTLKEVLVEDKKDPDEYDRKMRTLWPKKFIPQKFHWRDNEHTV